MFSAVQPKVGPARSEPALLKLADWLLVVPALVLALAATAAPANAAPATGGGAAPVTGWIDMTLREISAHRVNPPRASRALALVSVALDRAAAEGQPALHGSAAEVLAYLFPDRATFFEARAAELSPSRPVLERGRRIGAQVVDRGRSDRSADPYTGTRLFGTGYWTEPVGVAGPLESAACQWLPWNIPSGSAYRPPRPPHPDDATYAEQVREVHEVSAGLSGEQRAIALFWADGAGTETPAGHWNRIAMDLAGGASLSHTKAARLFALLNTAQADAFIAGWDAKFAYWSERPVQAIRRMIDPDWSPLIPTPPFPGYVSGHSTTSGAASTVLAAFFPARAGDLAAWAGEAAISRLYGGIHFQVDNDAGLTLGRRVGQTALSGYDGR